MKVTILGSGASSGVPLIGCECAVCTSPNPRNKRSRVSVMVETQGKALLIDTAPDLREQFLREGLKTADAILYTHAHADHLHGIDDIRSLNFHKGGPIPCYADTATLAELKERFGYVFKPPIPEYGWFRPCLMPHEIKPEEPFAVEGITITPFRQIHGRLGSLGFRIGDFAYSTDVNDFPPESEKYLHGLDLWIVDCLKPESAPTHAHLAKSLGWIEKYKPKRAILTHLAHEFDYEALKAQCPPGVEPGYDGMTISCGSM